MDYQHIQIPSVGGKITVNDDFSLNVPDNPIIPFIEGDGIGIAPGAIAEGTVTSDFERQMEGATLLSCSEFGKAMIARM